MGWIALVMLILIAASLVLEWVLPMRLKDAEQLPGAAPTAA